MKYAAALIPSNARSLWGQLSHIAWAGLIAGKPAPTGIAQGLSPMRSRWERACPRIAVQVSDTSLVAAVFTEAFFSCTTM